MLYRRVGPAIVVAGAVVFTAVAVPLGFPASGNGIWFTEPGRGVDFWADDWQPVGNGYLAGQSTGVTSGCGL